MTLGDLLKIDYSSPFIIHIMKVKAEVEKKPNWYKNYIK